MSFKRREELDKLVEEVINSFENYRLDIANITHHYLFHHQHEYVRTLDDILDFFEGKPNKKILEVGCFFGVISICLSKLGFEVYSLDMPEVLSSTHQQKLTDYGLTCVSARLQNYVMPFEDDFFDCIIMCEVLEHLNFNPVPLIKEINRIGKKGSLFYVSLPNIVHLHHRLQFLKGQSFHFSIEEFFEQLEEESVNRPIEPHWREYTMKEIEVLLENMGYSIKKNYYFCVLDYRKELSLKNHFTKLLLNLFPSLKENQTTLAVKERDFDKPLYIPPAWSQRSQRQKI